MQASIAYFFISFYNWRWCEIGCSVSVQLIWSARLVLTAWSHSRHVLMPVSSMKICHEWFALCWTCTVLKGRGWQGQAILGGCLYIICQDDMLSKCLSSWFMFFFFCSYPDFPFWGRDQTAALMQYFIFSFFPLLFGHSLFIKALDQRAELFTYFGWQIQYHTQTHVQYLQDDSY